MSDSERTKPPGEIARVSPSWDELYRLAAAQSGWFTGQQAAALGFSDQLLSKHARSGRLERGWRGVYRISRFPPAEHEDLVVAWLWSGRMGVVSHESALQIHGLSDSLPARIHLTLPRGERARERRIPEGTVLHFADVPDAERMWSGPVPVTAPARTVGDVADGHGDAVLVEQAVEEGIRRGLFHAREVARAIAYAAGFELPGATRVFPEAVADFCQSWFFQHFGGRCQRRPPADWPTVASEIAHRHGGRIYSQRYFPGSNSVLLDVVWPPTVRPPPERIEATRSALSEVFSWS